MEWMVVLYYSQSCRARDGISRGLITISHNCRVKGGVIGLSCREGDRLSAISQT